MSREQDGELHPAAVARQEAALIEKRNVTTRFYAGLVIAAAGLAWVFFAKDPYIGFPVALLGTGIIPVDKFIAIFRK